MLKIFGDRHETHFDPSQHGADGSMVLQVAGQSVQLVDDESVDGGVGIEAAQQLLELRPVCGAGAFARVAVLVDELAASVRDPAGACLPLGRERIALFGLLLGRHPCVDERAHFPSPIKHVASRPSRASWTL